MENWQTGYAAAQRVDAGLEALQTFFAAIAEVRTGLGAQAQQAAEILQPLQEHADALQRQVDGLRTELARLQQTVEEQRQKTTREVEALNQTLQTRRAEQRTAIETLEQEDRARRKALADAWREAKAAHEQALKDLDAERTEHAQAHRAILRTQQQAEEAAKQRVATVEARLRELHRLTLQGQGEEA